ncbi:hypothetical protein ABEO83_04030 [Bacillus glycinifermentans]|uniref:hypothetical protein n=1 Tax=Bacillus sp. FSL W8-0848 TaxID=2954634 RepID=UPI001F1B37F1|nr:hypothetical protein [Bacillus glycinifermentans]
MTPARGSYLKGELYIWRLPMKKETWYSKQLYGIRLRSGVPKTGVALQNRDYEFKLDPNHPTRKKDVPYDHSRIYHKRR